MPIMFNAVLQEAGFQLSDVRLIRHKDNKAKKGHTPYELWRDNRQQFESYQSTQTIANRPKLMALYWAVFVVNLNNEALFAGKLPKTILPELLSSEAVVRSVTWMH